MPTLLSWVPVTNAMTQSLTSENYLALAACMAELSVYRMTVQVMLSERTEKR